MKTRQDYLNQKCTHSEYYAQFVTESTKRILLSRISKKELVEALREDPNLNSIKLTIWDGIGLSVTVNMKEYGDTLTKSGRVCILKEAARQICNEE